MDTCRKSRFRLLIALILTTAVLGLVFHLHPAGHDDSDFSCATCYLISFWLMAAPIIITLLCYRRTATTPVLPRFVKRQPVHFARPPLRAPPLSCA